ncbi:MAG: hypothetical protein AAGA86_03060 [Bacteroidota bacterium]
MIVQVKNKLLKEHFSEIGCFQFYEDIIVEHIAQGVHVTFENAVEVIQIGERIYGTEKPFVYISHRLNSYSMDPIGYKDAVQLFPNFKGLAVVAHSNRKRMLAQLEKAFMKRPMGVFDNLQSAFFWAEKLLSDPNTRDYL